MGWLIQEKIPFNIRIRNNSYTTNNQGYKIPVDRLFYGLKQGEILNIAGARRLGTCSVYLSALRLTDSQLLIIANSSFKQNTIEIYGLRWEIETFFGCLKGRGFNLEDTVLYGIFALRNYRCFLLLLFVGCIKSVNGNMIVFCR